MLNSDVRVSVTSLLMSQYEQSMVLCIVNRHMTHLVGFGALSEGGTEDQNNEIREVAHLTKYMIG